MVFTEITDTAQAGELCAGKRETREDRYRSQAALGQAPADLRPGPVPHGHRGGVLLPVRPGGQPGELPGQRALPDRQFSRRTILREPGQLHHRRVLPVSAGGVPGAAAGFQTRHAAAGGGFPALRAAGEPGLRHAVLSPRPGLLSSAAHLSADQRPPGGGGGHALPLPQYPGHAGRGALPGDIPEERPGHGHREDDLRLHRGGSFRSRLSPVFPQPGGGTGGHGDLRPAGGMRWKPLPRAI